LVLPQRILGTPPIKLAANLVEQSHAAGRIIRGQIERHVDIERAASLSPESQSDGTAQGVFATGSF
jgi:hypothetical protein